MRLSIATASQKSRSEDTLLVQSIDGSGLRDQVHRLYFYGDNKDALPIVYNEAIRKALEDNSTHLLLVHDDVSLSDFNIFRETYMQGFDVVGVAGADNVSFNRNPLWHHMAEPRDLHGFAGHYNADGQTVFMTNFGSTPHKTQVIDGVFMLLDLRKNIPNFDESNPAKFHFYDLDFSYSAYKAGLNVGVAPYVIWHKSHGLRQITDDWRAGAEWFVRKWR